MSDLITVADYGDLCGEGPIWDEMTGHLYWTDIVGQQFYRYHAASGKHEVVKQGLEIHGFRFNRPGGFVITNSQGIWLWDGADKLKSIADEVDGSKCHVNDCVADPAGRLFTGSHFYNPTEEYEMGKLIRVDTDGAVTVVDEGFHLSNGLAFSPDSKTLYFTDSVSRCIYAYDYDVSSGEVSRRRVLIKVPSTEGLPDGMTVDAEGFIWSAQWYGSCVVRYDADGKVERRIQTPAKQTTAVTFGGERLTDLFITSAAKYGPLPIMPPGYDPNSGYFGGRLYQLSLGIQGKPEYKANIFSTQ